MPRKRDDSKNRVTIRGLGQLYRRTDAGVWHLSFSAHGQQVRESTKSEKYQEALGCLKRRVAEVESGSFISVKTDKTKVSDLLDDVLADYLLKAKRSYDNSAVPCIEYHLKPVLANVRAANLRLSHLKEYVAGRLKESAAPSSINREIAMLRRAYSLGVAARKVSPVNVPPFREVILNENNVREGFFEHDEYLRFKEALSVENRPVLIFGYWTGCRYAEIVNLEWEQVDLERGLVYLKRGTTKNKKPRIIPIGRAGLGDLRDMLMAQKALHSALCADSPWVFFRHSQRRCGARISNINKAWAAARAESGVDKLFHDLRRTGVRNLVRAGVPEAVAMRISGHLTRSVFERYNIVDEEDLHDAADKLAKYVTGQEA